MRVVLRQARSLGGRSLRNRARGRLTDIRTHVREVQQAVRIDHDFLGAGERRGEMPQVPEFEGRAALQWSRSADVEEELSVRDDMKCPCETPRCLTRDTFLRAVTIG